MRVKSKGPVGGIVRQIRKTVPCNALSSFLSFCDFYRPKLISGNRTGKLPVSVASSKHSATGPLSKTQAKKGTEKKKTAGKDKEATLSFEPDRDWKRLSSKI